MINDDACRCDQMRGIAVSFVLVAQSRCGGKQELGTSLAALAYQPPYVVC